MFCPRCGRQNDDTANYCQGCASPLTAPTVTGTTIPSSAPAGALQYATFGQRLVATLIDVAILSLATGSVVVATFGMGITLGFFAPWLYEAFMMSSEWQATVGKKALGLVVTDMAGQRVSFARSTGRHFGKIITNMVPFFIGYIMAGLTARRQALHDMIAETLVIKR